MPGDAIPSKGEDCSMRTIRHMQDVSGYRRVNIHPPFNSPYCPKAPGLEAAVEVCARALAHHLGLVCTSAAEPSAELLLAPD